MPIPFVTITLDRPYDCRFSYRASIRYQQITGKTLLEVPLVTMENMPGLLQAVLQEHIPDLTIEQTIELLDKHVDSLYAVLQLVAACIDAAYNLDDENPNVKALTALGKNPNTSISGTNTGMPSAN